MINIALFGPPGAGKGTQSRHLVEKYGLVYISTGDMLRKEITNGSEIGKKVKSIIDAGGLVDDEYIVYLIEKVIKENGDKNGFLFDGFPRTYVQAYILEGLLQKLHKKLTCMISLQVPKVNLEERLLDRAKKEDRNDDTEEIIRVRLEEYENKTIPVAAFYQDKGIYYPVDGTGSIEDVSARVDAALDEAMKNILLNVVVYGYPGAGKGTQCKRLAEHFNLVYISIGRILREEIQSGTELGKRSKPYIEKGILVPDEIVIQVIEDRIRVNPQAQGFVFKGFPRTKIQTYIMDGFMEKMHSSISAVVNLDISSLTCVKRLSSRGKTEEGRSYDENLEFIIQRLQEYEKKTIPVIENFPSKIPYIKINGDDDRDVITKQMIEAVEAAFKRS
jgi:adenylate kinase